MPMIPVEASSSTLALTSVVSAAITFGFCRALDVSAGAAVVISAVVGIGLYAIGVIPIGLLLVFGAGMIWVIVKSLFTEKKPPE